MHFQLKYSKSFFFSKPFVLSRLKLFCVRLVQSGFILSHLYLTKRFLLFEGQTVSAAIEYDSENTAAVELKVSSHWVNFQRYTGRFTNTNSQQVHYSGDTGFDRAIRVQKDIIWQQPPE